MKRLVVTMLTVLTCGAAYALPVGNPSEASLLCDGLIWEGHCGDPCDPCLTWCDAFSFRVGFYGDYVFNRHLKVRNDLLIPGNNGRKIEHAEIYTNAGYIAANLWDRIDVFTTLGATNAYLRTNDVIFNPATRNGVLEVETTTSFSWSVGGRATLWECGCTSLGIEGQYFRTKPRIRRITDFTGSAVGTQSVYPDDSLSARYQEWQVGLGVSHRIHMFVPYIAVKWAGCRTNVLGSFETLPSDALSLRNDKRWGYAVGVSLVDCEKAALTVEGRFADEKAVYVNGQIRF